MRTFLHLAFAVVALYCVFQLSPWFGGLLLVLAAWWAYANVIGPALEPWETAPDSEPEAKHAQRAPEDSARDDDILADDWRPRADDDERLADLISDLERTKKREG